MKDALRGIKACAVAAHGKAPQRPKHIPKSSQSRWGSYASPQDVALLGYFQPFLIAQILVMPHPPVECGDACTDLVFSDPP